MDIASPPKPAMAASAPFNPTVASRPMHVQLEPGRDDPRPVVPVAVPAVSPNPPAGIARPAAAHKSIPKNSLVETHHAPVALITVTVLVMLALSALAIIVFSTS